MNDQLQEARRFQPPIVTGVTHDGLHFCVADWPGLDPPIVFTHGLTSTHRNVAGLATFLEGRIRVVAPDLRGRGLSSKPGEGSYGIDQHAKDVIGLMDQLGIEHAVFAGHSMGATVAVTAASFAGDRAVGLILVDGGITSLPPGVEVDWRSLMDGLLAPILDRLDVIYKTPQEYLARWKEMPYFEDRISPQKIDYLMYDLGRVKEGYRPKCSRIAATEDWADLFESMQLRTRLDSIACPVLAVAAEYGLTRDQPPVLGAAQEERLAGSVERSTFVRIDGTNHHSVIISERGAAATAKAISEFLKTL